MGHAGQCLPPLQPWMSDTEESPFLDPALRKRAVKVKHVKRREKKSEKKVMERVKRCAKAEGGAGEAEGQKGVGCEGDRGVGLTSARPRADLCCP